MLGSVVSRSGTFDGIGWRRIAALPNCNWLESADTPEEQARQRDAWITIQRSHAVANNIPVLSANRIGFEGDPSEQTAGSQFWGSSMIVGWQGELLAQADTSSTTELVVELDLDRTEQVRRWWPYLRDRRIDAYEDIVKRYRD